MISEVDWFQSLVVSDVRDIRMLNGQSLSVSSHWLKVLSSWFVDSSIPFIYFLRGRQTDWLIDWLINNWIALVISLSVYATRFYFYWLLLFKITWWVGGLMNILYMLFVYFKGKTETYKPTKNNSKVCELSKPQNQKPNCCRCLQFSLLYIPDCFFFYHHKWQSSSSCLVGPEGAFWPFVWLLPRTSQNNSPFLTSFFLSFFLFLFG